MFNNNIIPFQSLISNNLPYTYCTAKIKNINAERLIYFFILLSYTKNKIINTGDQTNNISHPMPTESLVCASDPRPDTMIMAESGTAPSSGRTIPPGEKDYIHPLGFHAF